MKRTTLYGSRAERMDQINIAAKIAEEEAKKFIEKQRRHYTINSENFSEISEEEEGFLAKHPLRRG